MHFICIFESIKPARNPTFWIHLDAKIPCDKGLIPSWGLVNQIDIKKGCISAPYRIHAENEHSHNQRYWDMSWRARRRELAPLP